VGELAASRRVTVLPIQNGRNWLYESTSAMSGYNDGAGYLSSAFGKEVSTVSFSVC
jgi:hypothetical protein